MQTNNTVAFARVSANKDLRRIERIERLTPPLVLEALVDSTVLEIMFNSDGLIYVERLGRLMQCIGTMDMNKLEALILAIAEYHKQTITAENPVFSGTLPSNGARVEAIIPPAVESPVLCIRLKASSVFTLDDYVQNEIMMPKQKDIIVDAVRERKNILVVGSTGSGKTTLTNAIIAEIVRVKPEHRLIIIEDTQEIQCAAENRVILQATETVSMLRLLKSTMRLRPDRILVGEVRGPEALALLKAWNTGHPGGVATIHANSAHAGLIRMEQLIAEATETPMQRLIAEAVDLIIFIQKTETGRKVSEIVEVSAFTNNHYVTHHH